MEFQKSALASLLKTPLNEPTRKCTVIRVGVSFQDKDGRNMLDVLKGKKIVKVSIGPLK